MAPADTSGVKIIFKALKANKLVGMLTDQVPGVQGGCHVPFFNKDAQTMTLAGKLYKKLKPVVFTVATVRDEIGRGIHATVAPFEPYLKTDLNTHKYEDKFAYAMNQAFEDIIRQTPEQYLWSYKRFKYLADGEDPYAK